MSTRTKALLAILLATLLWSTAGLSKIVVRTFDPYFAGFLRFFVATLVILPFFLKEKINGRAIFRDLVPLSLLGTGNLLFYYLGLQTSTANAATLIYAGVPLVTALIAHYVINERLTARKLIGIMTCLVGVFVVAALPILERRESVSGDLTGNIFFVLAVLVWSLYIIGSRRATTTQQYSPLQVSSITIFTTCVVFFITSLFSFRSSYLISLQQPSMILLVVHLGVFVTVATFTLYQWAIKHSSATTASYATYAGPVVSVAINVIVLGETITSGFVAGALIIFTGLMIVSGKSLFAQARS